MKNRAKIAFIGNTPPPYHGVCIQNRTLLNSVLKDEFDLIHIPSSPNKSLKDVGRISVSNFTGAFKSYIKFIKVLLKDKPEIAYFTIAQNSVGFFRDGIFVLINYLLGRAKIVLHCRGSYYREKYNTSSVVYRLFADFVYSKSDYCIVLGKNLTGMMEKWFKPEQILVIPNGTSFSLTRYEKKYNKEKLRLGYLGMLSREKGFYELLEILKSLLDKYSNSEAVIGGSFVNDSIESDYREFIRKNGLENRVFHWGNVINEEKEKFYAETDILIFPSWTEGHPNVILEAMASGLPVVASDVGAIPETIINGINGFVVRSKDIAGFINKTEEIINNGLIEKMGLASKKLYEENYTEEKYINKIVKSFKNILSSNETD